MLDAVRVAHPSDTDIELLARLSIQDSVQQTREDTEQVLWSGATEVDVEILEGHPAALEVMRSEPDLGASLEELVAPPLDLTGTEVVLDLVFQPTSYVELPPLPRAISLAIVRGEIETWADYEAARVEWRAERAWNGETALAPVLAELVALGARVIRSEPWLLQARVTVEGEAIRDVLAHTDVVWAGLAPGPREGPVDDAGYAWTVSGESITGYEAEDLLQSTQFYDRGYEAANLWLGMSENRGHEIFIDHPGFENGSSSQRVINCDKSSFPIPQCIYTDPDTDAEAGEHSTAVASVLVGDLTADQDATHTGDLPQRRRSGVARGAMLVGQETDDSTMVADLYQSWNVAITNQSWSTGEDDCEGTDTWSNTFNDLYEEGIASFKSAGNSNDPTDPDDCDIGAPGSAIGVFPVAAYGVDALDAEVITSSSSKGGTGVLTDEGAGRTIVGLAGPAGWENAYPNYAWPLDTNSDPFHYGVQWAGSPDPGDFCCTSAATPAVAGSAALMRDFMEDVYGTAIYDPGRLYALMMLWGDGHTEAGQIDIGFDQRWGAGRLRLRQPDSTGLDGPMGFGLTEVCVDHGTSVSVDIATSALGGDVDVMRAVAWWYDRRHGAGTPHDDIDLKVKHREPLAFWQVVDSSLSDDNRERVQLHTADFDVTREYKLTLEGTSVTADDEGCGANSMRVFVAWFFEDSDREFAEALDTVRPE